MTTFIGPVANQGGPAIKNAITLKYLGAQDINIINTYGTSPQARIKSFLKTLFCQDDQILIGVSSKGRALLWPVIRLKAAIHGRLSYGLICIGGTIAEEAAANARLISSMRGADIVAVETTGVKIKLADLDIVNNVVLFPNFVEDLNSASLPKANVCQSQTFRCVFLSSIRNKKGIKTMIAACQAAIDAGCNMTLDIYGPIKADFDRHIFDGLFPGGPIVYKGVAQKDQVTAILSNYDCFVFPSEYEGEGFPSVLAEAMAVGLPVIASDICYNKEIVGDNCGWVYRAGNQRELKDLFISCARNPSELKRISAFNIQHARGWDARQVISTFSKQLTERGWSL